MLHSPRQSNLISPQRSSFRSPLNRTHSDDRSSVRSTATVYDMVDESVRVIEDKQSNIDEYRQSVLTQLDEADSLRQSIMSERYKKNVALQFMGANLKQRVVAHWKAYSRNEVKVWRDLREHNMKSLCWAQWRRMLFNIHRTENRRQPARNRVSHFFADFVSDDESCSANCCSFRPNRGGRC